MTHFADYDRYDALGLVELLRSGEVHPRELVREALERIDRVNPRLNAVVQRLDERALESAERVDPQRGPLAGVPMLLKDLLQTLGGVPTTGGSRFFRGFVAERDSELIRRYGQAGLLFLGKTNTPEFGLAPVTEPELHGPTRNPWDPARTPGGSSGGAAAAVAAGVVPVAHGGDGGGSIRIPASCCGLFGLKPTRARNPVGPDASERWNGFVQEHVLTRTVRDSAALLDASAGPEPTAAYHAPPPERSHIEEVNTDPGRLRIAFHSEPAMPASVHPDCVAAVQDAASLCEELGHEVVELPPRHDPRALARAFFTVVCAQTAAELVEAEQRTGRRATPDRFERPTWLAAMVGRRLTAEELALAVRRLQAEARRLVSYYADWDVVLTPTLSRPPVPLGALDPGGTEGVLHEVLVRGRLGPVLKLPGVIELAIDRVFDFSPFTPVANFSGQPSMTVPLYWNAEGLPIGSMFTGRFGDEATLFRLGAQLEQARPWFERRPPIHAGAGSVAS